MTGFGVDTYCYDQIFTGRMASGVHVLAQACYRRLTTARGTLDDGEEGSVYGLDIEDFIGRVGTASSVDAIPGLVQAELLKDDRVDSIDTRASVVHGVDGLDSITIDLDVFPKDESGAFTLSVSVSEVTIALLGVTPL